MIQCCPGCPWELHPGSSRTGGAGSWNLGREFPKTPGCAFLYYPCVHPRIPASARELRELREGRKPLEVLLRGDLLGFLELWSF